MTDQTSELLYMRAKLRLPGGVNSPVRAYQAVGRTPRFIQSAKGSHITDVDGNEMIDYVCSWGPGILGHADPRVIEKVKAACEEGLTFGAPTEREVEMAELLAQLVPSMEVSRLVSSGTEATMSAIRVARGYTKRDKIIKFRGCYHGHSDGLLVKAGSAALTTSVPDSAGVPADFTRHTPIMHWTWQNGYRKGKYNMTDQTSELLYMRAKLRLPGGVNSPVRAYQAVGRTPRFIQSAKGSHITDVDGNEMIDYVCSWGPGILGHADPRVIEKVKAACEEGLTFGAPTEREVEMAELLAQLVPSMEVSRLVSSGTEATMSAIRVARGYTKRDKIIKFRGCYHGHSDGLLVKAGSAALTTSVPDSAGVPADFTRHTLVAEYNSPDSVKALFEAYPDEIAAIIVEPVAANMGVVPPADGFLEFLREITKHYGALFIFDEVITGFRLALGGAQEYFHITPDLSTFGKIIGGGMPVGAYGGREDIMRMVSPDGPVYQAGTLSGNPIATAAGLATLRILEADTDIYMRLQENTAMLADAVRHAAGNRVHVNQIGSLMSIFFTGEDVTDYDSATTADTKAYADYFGFMLDHGIYVAPSQFESMFVSDAHTDADIQKTIHVMQEYFAE